MDVSVIGVGNEDPAFSSYIYCEPQVTETS